MSETVTYLVPGMHGGNCKAAVEKELLDVEEVDAVEVDLDSKVVTINGSGLNDPRLRAAIADAGCEAA